MSEIQSAGEFAMVALDIYSDEVMPKDKKNIEILTGLIRSRDKAIVVKYTDRILALFEPSKYHISPAGKEAIKAQMESFLRDLGIE